MIQANLDGSIGCLPQQCRSNASHVHDTRTKVNTMKSMVVWVVNTMLTKLTTSKVFPSVQSVHWPAEITMYTYPFGMHPSHAEGPLVHMQGHLSPHAGTFSPHAEGPLVHMQGHFSPHAGGVFTAYMQGECFFLCPTVTCMPYSHLHALQPLACPLACTHHMQRDL